MAMWMSILVTGLAMSVADWAIENLFKELEENKKNKST